MKGVGDEEQAGLQGPRDRGTILRTTGWGILCGGVHSGTRCGWGHGNGVLPARPVCNAGVRNRGSDSGWTAEDRYGFPAGIGSRKRLSLLLKKMTPQPEYTLSIFRMSRTIRASRMPSARMKDASVNLRIGASARCRLGTSACLAHVCSRGILRTIPIRPIRPPQLCDAQQCVAQGTLRGVGRLSIL